MLKQGRSVSCVCCKSRSSMIDMSVTKYIGCTNYRVLRGNGNPRKGELVNLPIARDLDDDSRVNAILRPSIEYQVLKKERKREERKAAKASVDSPEHVTMFSLPRQIGFSSNASLMAFTV